mgnify:CR=1 FL=1
MPMGDWYSLPEVQRETGLTYAQVLTWARRHLRNGIPPEWIQQTTKGIWVRQDGLTVLRRERPDAHQGGAE